MAAMRVCIMKGCQPPVNAWQSVSQKREDERSAVGALGLAGLMSMPRGEDQDPRQPTKFILD